MAVRMAVSTARDWSFSHHTIWDTIWWQRGEVRGGCTFEAACLDTYQFPFNTFAQSYCGFSCDILLEQMILHALHGFLEVFLRQHFASYDIPEQASDSAQTRANNAGGSALSGLLGICPLKY